MLMHVDRLPVCLEALNMRDKPIAQIAATLHHLTGQSAVLVLDAGTPAPCLHWGSRVRFLMETDSQRYVVTGSVAGLHPHAAESVGAPVTTDIAREVLLRLWECRPVPQRRNAPRRRTDFAVRCRELCEEAGSEPAWQAADCVDISAGGIRLRIALPETMPKRLALEITLPDTSAPLCLQGRVLRSAPVKRGVRRVELAVKFERPGVRESLALARLMLD